MPSILSNETAHRWVSMFSQEHGAILARMAEATHAEAELRGKMLALATGTVAFVVPMLAGRPIVTSPQWLWRGSVALIVAIIVGVIVFAGARWLQAWSTLRLGRHYQSLIEATGLIATNGEEAASERLAELTEAFALSQKRLMPRLLALAAASDLAFYAPLIGGLACVLRSIFR
jgi:hypothetical protein